MPEWNLNKLRNFFPNAKEKINTAPSFEYGRLSRASSEHPFTNEDAILILEKKRVFAIFDGIQGLKYARDVAQLAKEKVHDYVMECLPDDAPLLETISVLEQAVLKAHEAIVRFCYNCGKECGTTCIVAHLHKDSDGSQKIIILHVGDNRGYGSRSEKLRILTLDDLYAWPPQQSDESDTEYYQRLYDLQLKLSNVVNPHTELVPDELVTYLQRNIINQHLGANNTPFIHVGTYSFKPGDIFLFCSDGLSDNSTHDEIHYTIENNRHLPAQALAEKLCDDAYEVSQNKNNKRAKPDDVSVIIIKNTQETESSHGSF